MKLISYVFDVQRRLRDDEDGLALTEYLILLGLLTGAVIGAVLLFGTGLSEAWEDWAAWMTAVNLGYDATS